jgi:hypothetical protein
VPGLESGSPNFQSFTLAPHHSPAQKASSAADRLSTAPPQASCGLQSTHRIEKHGEEELAPIDDFVQLTGATRVLIVEDGMCEKATGLPREDLGWRGRRAMASPDSECSRRGLPYPLVQTQPLLQESLLPNTL